MTWRQWLLAWFGASIILGPIIGKWLGAWLISRPVPSRRAERFRNTPP